MVRKIMQSSIKFDVSHRSGKARRGILETPHGKINSPFFMTVGTIAAVKGLTPQMLRECGCEIVLANTYHLSLRPGEELVNRFGGLSKFMGWNGPTLTDSGGYQVYSLVDINKITDDGVSFSSHIDGSKIFISPERSVHIQQNLGADMFMAFDECPAGDSSHEVVAESIERTFRWAVRSKEAWTNREKQALFGIVQGGVYEDLRKKSAEQIVSLDFPGNAIGGVSVGEEPAKIDRVVEYTAALLPDDKPRYLMGVGRPQDIIRAIGHGVDMFDCVMPTRHARHAEVFTRKGKIKIRNLKYRDDHAPIEEDCDCYVCKNLTRGYLRHLFIAKEMLGPIYAAMHNIRFYMKMLEDAREAIEEDRYEEFSSKFLADIEGSSV